MKFNQKGFGVIEILLTIIALTMIVGLIMYGINANKDKKEQLDNAQTSSSEETSPKEDKEQLVTFDFDDVEVTVPKDSVKDLIYTRRTDISSGPAYDVTTEAFQTLGAQCGEVAPTGVLIFTESGSYPGQGNEGFNGLIKQLKSTYVAFGDGLYGTMGCSETVYDQLYDMQKDIVDKLKAAFNKAEEI